MAEKKTKQDIGQELYFLKPVSHIKKIDEQIKEIDRRLKILWDKRQSHDPPLPIAPAHIQASLGLIDKIWHDWINADTQIKVQGIDDRVITAKMASEDAVQDLDRVRLIRARSDLLTQWLKRCESTMLDTAQNPLHKGGQQGSIKGLEMCYGYKTTEQLEVVSKGDDLSIGLEAFRKRQAAKAKKTS